MARDPVCGMEVDPKKSNWVAEYNGEDYYFCSESCQKAFMKDPAKYSKIRPMGHSHGGARSTERGLLRLRHGQGLAQLRPHRNHDLPHTTPFLPVTRHPGGASWIK